MTAESAIPIVASLTFCEHNHLFSLDSWKLLTALEIYFKQKRKMIYASASAIVTVFMFDFQEGK